MEETALSKHSGASAQLTTSSWPSRNRVQAGAFLESRVRREAISPLLIGVKLRAAATFCSRSTQAHSGQYEIIVPMGAGGMGD